MTVQEQAQKARTAALTLSSATRAAKDAALLAMADALAKAETAILEANDARRRPRGGEWHQRGLDRSVRLSRIALPAWSRAYVS